MWRNVSELLCLEHSENHKLKKKNLQPLNKLVIKSYDVSVIAETKHTDAIWFVIYLPSSADTYLWWLSFYCRFPGDGSFIISSRSDSSFCNLSDVVIIQLTNCLGVDLNTKVVGFYRSNRVEHCFPFQNGNRRLWRGSYTVMWRQLPFVLFCRL